MEESDFQFQITTKAPRFSKNFVYRGKYFPFDFHLFKQNSNYFYKNRAIIKNVENINLLNKDEENRIDFSDEVIQTFISICQKEFCRINLSNAIQLQYLSQKYEVSQLIAATSQYISQNRKELIFQTILFKSQLCTEKVSDTIISNYDTKSEEDILVTNIDEFIQKDELLSLPISILDRIFHKYFNCVKKSSEKVDNKEIVNFFFKCLDKYGTDASILFSYVDFKKQPIEVMNRLLNDYSNVFDFSMINSTLLQTTTMLVSDLVKMKEEYSNEFTEMRRMLKEQQKELKRITEENQKMKLDEEKRSQQREELFQKKLNLMQEEIENQRKKFDDELQKIKSKHDKVNQLDDVQNYHKIVREMITDENFNNFSDETKNYVVKEIISKPIKFEPNQKVYSLLKQIFCFNNIFKESLHHDDSQIENVKEFMKNPFIGFDMIKSLHENKMLKTAIIMLMSSFNDISIEIKFPSDCYDEIMNTLCNIERKNLDEFSKINIMMVISDVEKVKSDPRRNLLISKCKVESSVDEISSAAFISSKRLKVVDIEHSIKKIGKRAFYECKSLTKITVPSSVISIDDYAFFECSSLTQIAIPASVENIGEFAFCRCSSLIKVEIPSSVKRIGDYAFNYCLSLSTVSFEMPSLLKSFGNCIFQLCCSLSQISIPPTVETIPTCAFYECSSLEQIIIPSCVKCIEDSAFKNCSSLCQISLEKASSLTTIKSYAFGGCTSLTKISIPPSVNTISSYAFKSCSSLIEILIPSKLSVSFYDIGNKVTITKF